MASVFILGAISITQIIIMVCLFAIPFGVLIFQLTRKDISTEYQASNQSIYAGFWLRFVAAIIDGIVIFIGGTIIWTLFNLPIPPDAKGPILGRLYIFSSPWSYVIALFYHAILEFSPWQGSLGKRILRLKVTDKFGYKISFLRATGRNWGKFLSLLTFYLGFIMIAFTKRKQGLHDLVTNCLVIRQPLSNGESIKIEQAEKIEKPEHGIMNS